ncbi:MAG: QueT transporter family protein [Bacteroidales bacterium]|nr:QueT transporter family protein [Bacteroidales bacterium]
MKSAKTIAINGIIAALYIALTLISPFSFGVVNIRLSDVIPAIGCIDKRYRWGVTVGMILANLFSPYGLVDVCVAVLICFCAFFLGGQKVEIRAVILIFATATFVSLELSVVEKIPFLWIFIEMLISETLLTILGLTFFRKIEKTYKKSVDE